MKGSSRQVDLAEWPVAILAGGLATRLRPITEKIPKALVEVAGAPFLQHQLQYLRAQGVRRVVVCAGYLGDRIEAAFGDGGEQGLAISYSFDGARLLGTGGALKHALPLLGPRFFVLYGDSYLLINYAAVAEAFVASGKSGLMTVFRNEGQWDTSNVVFSDNVIRLYSKKQRHPQMNYIDYGLGVLTRRVFEAWPANEVFDLADVYTELAARGELAGFEARNRFYEIGSREGLVELDLLLRSAAPAPIALKS